MDNEAFQSRGCSHVPDADSNNTNILQHSCCKLDAYDWLKDIDPGHGNTDFNIIEARFKNSRKEFFAVPEGLRLSEGDIIAVEAQPGHDIAIVTLTGHIVSLQMKRKKVSPESDRVKKVYRKARNSDIEKWVSASNKENSTMITSRKIVGELDLDMKINDVEYQGDNTKVVFYYTAEGRVDFRRLIKLLAEEFRVRIEMKQIGVRQESGRLGGIGSCGRELCCSSWLTNFNSVSTVAARSQQLALNPQKLAGQCGKLKCCLNFEYNSYTEALKKFPASNIRLKTKKGDAYYIKADVFKEIMWYSYADHPGGMFPVSVKDAHHIISLNKQNKYPDTLDDFAPKAEEEEVAASFENVIGHDDLDRFDKKQKSSPRNNNRNSNNRNAKQSNASNGNRRNNRNQDNRSNDKRSSDKPHDDKNHVKAKANNGNQGERKDHKNGSKEAVTKKPTGSSQSKNKPKGNWQKGQKKPNQNK